MATGQGARGALAALAVLTLVWSFNWVVMKWAMRYAGPFDFSALRYAVGTVVVFVAVVARGRPLKPPPLLPVLLIGAAQTLGFQALVQWALVEGDAGKTALFAYSMPFWVVLLGWLLLSRKLAMRDVLAIVGAAIGLGLVIAPWHGLGNIESVALAIAGGFCWAVGTLAAKHYFERNPDASLLTLTAWQMLAGTVGLILVAALVPERAITWAPIFIAAVLYNGLLSSGLAWVLWSVIVKRLPAHVAGLSSLAVPVLGVGFAWLLLGEQPGLFESLGIALIVTALVAVNRKGRKQAAAP